MCNYGNGFTMMDVYKLPTHLRRFYYNQLVESKKREAKAAESTVKNTKSTSNKVRVRK
jgi:hypothetical protein